MQHANNKGFTLVELMIVIAIIGILAGIAIPSYTGYVARGRLIEAGVSLSAFRTSMEQYYQDQRTYASSVNATTCGVSTATLQATNFSYGCIVTGAGLNQGFIATASSVAGVGLGVAATYVYTISDNNVRTTSRFEGVNVPATTGTGCFLSRRGQQC
ncbi:MAG: prepilin-type N-terminal cleavage/methylation domain-containing protein [Gallionella sp.]